MSPRFEFINRVWLWKFFSGKHEHDVPSFVPEGHPVGEGILPNGPPQIHPQRLINPGASDVKGLVDKGLKHTMQFCPDAVARHLSNETNDSWHACSILGR